MVGRRTPHSPTPSLQTSSKDKTHSVSSEAGLEDGRTDKDLATFVFILCILLCIMFSYLVGVNNTALTAGSSAIEGNW
jgi:hypothetical protein